MNASTLISSDLPTLPPPSSVSLDDCVQETVVNAKTMEEILTLHRVDGHTFESTSAWIPHAAPCVFGGQLASQTVVAAAQTLKVAMVVQNVTSQFFRPCNATDGIRYIVESVTNGRSLASRNVVAYQNGKKMMQSFIHFGIPSPIRERYQDMIMAHLPPPDKVTTLEAAMGEWSKDVSLAHKVRQRLRSFSKQHIPFEMRPTPQAQSQDYLYPNPGKARQYMWMRASPRAFENQHQDHGALSALADFEALKAGGAILGVTVVSEGRCLRQIATLSFSMHHHAPFTTTEWLLYEISTVSYSQGRVLVLGRFFNGEGVHVASSVQEGLIFTDSSKL